MDGRVWAGHESVPVGTGYHRPPLPRSSLPQYRDKPQRAGQLPSCDADAGQRGTESSVYAVIPARRRSGGLVASRSRNPVSSADGGAAVFRSKDARRHGVPRLSRVSPVLDHRPTSSGRCGASLGHVTTRFRQHHQIRYQAPSRSSAGFVHLARHHQCRAYQVESVRLLPCDGGDAPTRGAHAPVHPSGSTSARPIVASSGNAPCRRASTGSSSVPAGRVNRRSMACAGPSSSGIARFNRLSNRSSDTW